jgi:hypothetical protein
MDCYLRIEHKRGWPPNTHVYELAESTEAATHLAVSCIDAHALEDGQAQAVPCNEKGHPTADTIQAIWWAAGTFTHAEVLDALGYTITDPPPAPEPEEL